MSDLDWLMNVKLPEPPAELVSFWISLEDTYEFSERQAQFAAVVRDNGFKVDVKEFDDLLAELPRIVEVMVTIDINKKEVVEMKWEGTEWPT